LWKGRACPGACPHAVRTRGLPDRLGAQEGVLALPPPVLPSAPTPNATGRVQLPFAADLAAPRRAPRRALLARHPARRQDNAGGHRDTLAPDHHPAEELA